MSDTTKQVLDLAARHADRAPGDGDEDRRGRHEGDDHEGSGGIPEDESLEHGQRSGKLSVSLKS